MKKLLLILFVCLLGCRQPEEVCFPSVGGVLDEMEAVPSAGMGNDGDRYLCKCNDGYFIYEKISGTWVHDHNSDKPCMRVVNKDTDNSDMNDYPEVWWFFSPSWVHLGVFLIEDKGGGVVGATALTNWNCGKVFFKLQYNNNGWKDIGTKKYLDGETVMYNIGIGEYDFRCVVFQEGCEWYKWGIDHVVIR